MKKIKIKENELVRLIEKLVKEIYYFDVKRKIPRMIYETKNSKYFNYR